MNKINLQTIRESFGRVVYSHKTHEKAAEIENKRSTFVKWANIILTTITSSTLISTIITSQTNLAYISAGFSTLTLAFTIFQLSFNAQEKAEKHKQIAKELWFIREKYVNFMADIITEKISEDTMIIKRDQLLEKLNLLYKFAPDTNNKSYKKAQDALKIDEELTFYR